MLKKLILLSITLCVLGLDSLYADSLIVGTNAEFPPYTYIQGGKIVGFDIDIAQECVKRMGKEMQLKDMPFDALIPEVVMGRVDFVAAGMSYTEERAKRVLFTKPYLTEDPLVILSKQKLTLEDLTGKNVVVIEGFTADLYMSKTEGIHLTRLPAQADGFLAIKSGRADAFVTAKSTLQAFLNTQDPSQFQVSIIEGTGETCALVVPKSKPEMLVALQAALDSMEKDGTLAALKTKWNL